MRQEFTFVLFLLLFGFAFNGVAQQDSSCSALKACKSGCCSKHGQCGFGPDFCGDGCQGSCNATAECGEYAPEGKFDCPLEVCCSKHGFCGTTSEFCNNECQNKGGCLPVLRPKCSPSSNALDSKVRIAYYGVWGASRGCNSIQPENIPAGVLTHINVAFEYVSEDHEITDESGPIVARTARLKKTYPGLRVNIALGGWVFNDPPTQYRFSDMASTVPKREKFINSLLRYLQKYNLDGVDIDWEYPVADDRGGIPEDFDNFVLLCSEIKQAFDSVDPGLQLTITLPSSYWYLRGFDIQRLEKHVDWFNVMTYDIHGLWDKTIQWTGPFLKGHTNITEIEEGLDLLWRNGIEPSKVVMGYGFYGRGFLMKDPKCNTPPNCQFSGPCFPGDCTNEAGILSYAEIQGHKEGLGSDIHYDEASTVKWMIYGSNQWISFDDAESFQRKKEYQSSRCLRGFMIWSLDLDTADFKAMNDLFGEEAMANALGDTSLNPREKQQLVEDLGAYTGQNCYVTRYCANSDIGKELGSSCSPGYTSMELAHAPWQLDQQLTLSKCKKGEYHHICCPTKHQPQNCEWVGAPKRSEFGCSRGCGKSQFELATDSYVDFRGEGSCYSGRRSLCCDSTEIIDQCYWTDCGPSSDNCKKDDKVVAWRLDTDSGSLCKGDGKTQTLRSYCCPKSEQLENCAWSNDVLKIKDPPSERWWRDMYTCFNKKCSAEQLAVTRALIPHTSIDWTKKDSINCADWPNYPGMSPEYPLCCDPPSHFNKKWPVDPSYLWSDSYNDKDDDVTWEWADNFGNNNHDIHPDDLDENPGADPYGFIMLDGPPGSINNAFANDFTVVQREEPLNVRRRSLVTSNQTVLESVFDHSEETILVYCNHPHDSQQCRRTFYRGAKDTIIRLPPHVGEGPWARIVSMEPQMDPELPSWVRRKRDVTENRNGIYKLKFDYNFHLIERDDGHVNMRVDYTNLKDYWHDITAEKVEKRSEGEAIPQMSFDQWKTKLEKAKIADQKRDGYVDTRETTVSFSPDKSLVTRSSSLDRRWFGPFGEWLSKLNNVKSGDQGVLPMGLSKFFTLYSGRLQCTNDAGVTIQAGLDITADINLEMRTRYSYYFSGTIVPPKIIDTYAYVGSQPRITAGVTVTGDASLTYISERKKIIDTLTYPGLAIKGIAAVGPSLDIWGQLDGSVVVRGSMRVGATYAMKPIEMYMPNDDDTRQKATKELDESHTDKEGITPQLEADVEAKVEFGVLVTPEVNMGIKIGGGIAKFKTSLVDAHVSAFVNTTLQFYASVKSRAAIGQGFSYTYQYGIKFFYRIGFAAVAEILLYGQWKTKAFFPFPKQEIDLYGPITVSSSNGNSKRSLLLDFPEKPLPNAIFEIPSGMSSLSDMELGIGRDLHPYSGNASSYLERRAEDKKNQEFKFGDFTCTTSTDSRCESDSLQIEQRDLSLTSSNGSATHQLEKRAATDCKKKLPKLYYNCLGYFSDYTFSLDPANGGTGNSIEIPGICTSVQRFLTNWMMMGDRHTLKRGTATSWILTWNPEDQGPRRRRACGSNLKICTEDNARKKATVFAPGNTYQPSLTNCDEFPFASSEEGGEGYYGLNGGPNSDILGTTRTCVPTWQNDMQGFCNALLNNLASNINYFNDPENPTDQDPEWRDWTEKGWARKGTWYNKQRLTLYPVIQPPSPGLTAAERANNKLSYFQKRNFTLQLAIPEHGSNDITFPGTGGVSGTLRDPSKKTEPKPASYTLTDASNVICAVSTSNQQRYRIAGSFNGWCWDGVNYNNLWGTYIRQIKYYSCVVNFSPPSSSTKRDATPIGYLGGDPIYSVERVEGNDIVIDLDEGDILPHNLPNTEKSFLV